MRIICPRCLGENHTANTRLGSRCTFCNCYFSPEDLEISLEWKKDIKAVQTIEVGSWQNDFSADDFWGQNDAGDGFWGHNV